MKLFHIVFFSLVGILLILFAFTDSVHFLMKEDGFVEYLSAFFWLSGFIISVWSACTRKFAKAKFIFIFAALICLVACGEEISWGQRIFNFETPDYIKEKNTQGEFNFHNLESMSGGSTWRHFFKTGEFNIKQILDAQNLFRLFMLTLFFFFPIIIRFKKAGSILTKIGYVKPDTYAIVLLWISIALVYLITMGGERLYLHNGQEIREMIFAYFSVSYVYFCSQYYGSIEAEPVQETAAADEPEFSDGEAQSAVEK